MNTYSNISGELKAFFANNSIFKILLPIDMVFLFGGLAIMILTNIFGINFGAFIYSVAYWAFILGLVLTYANMNEQFLYIGLLGYAALNAVNLIITLIKYGYFSWSYIVPIFIFGFLGYLVFKRTAIKS